MGPKIEISPNNTIGEKQTNKETKHNPDFFKKIHIEGKNTF